MPQIIEELPPPFFHILAQPLILIEVFLMITKFNEIEDPLSLFITIIIDVTRMIFLFELIYSSVTLRKIRKQAREGVSA